MKDKEEILPNIFLQNENTLWGCIDNNGKNIIPCKYDIITLCDIADEKQILCGRDGKQYTGYISKGISSSEVKTVYTGVYDLYSHKGRLRIGGFIDFNYNKDFKAYLFKFGRNYEYQKGNGTVSSPYRFKLPYGGWILLSSWFCFVESYSYTFQKSMPSDVWITENDKSIEGCILQYHNGFLQTQFRRDGKSFEPIVISNKVLFDDIKFVNPTTILRKRGKARASSYSIISVRDDKYSRFSHPVFNGNTIISWNYEWVKILDEHYTFVYNADKIGLLKDGRVAIPCEYSFITKPINGRCFAAIKYPFIPNKETWQKYFVILCDVNQHRYDFIKREDIIIAIDIISKEFLVKMFYEGDFLLYKTKNGICDTPSFIISNRYKHFFNTAFLQLMNPIFYDDNSRFTNYWLSSESVSSELENKYEQPEFHETYSIMDALDGDLEAYWNID